MKHLTTVIALALLTLTSCVDRSSAAVSSDSSSESLSFYDAHRSSVAEIEIARSHQETFVAVITSPICGTCIQAEPRIADFFTRNPLPVMSLNVFAVPGLAKTDFYQKGVTRYLTQGEYDYYRQEFADDPTTVRTPSFIMFDRGEPSFMLVGLTPTSYEAELTRLIRL